MMPTNWIFPGDACQGCGRYIGEFVQKRNKTTLLVCGILAALIGTLLLAAGLIGGMHVASLIAGILSLGIGISFVVYALWRKQQEELTAAARDSLEKAGVRGEQFQQGHQQQVQQKKEIQNSRRVLESLGTTEGGK